MFQDYAAVVKVFIYFVLFKMGSYFGSGNFPVVTLSLPLF